MNPLSSAIAKNKQKGTWGGKQLSEEVCDYLQVIENEEESFCGQSLVELYGVRVMRRYLMVVWQSGAWIPHKVLPLTNRQQRSTHQITQTYFYIKDNSCLQQLSP